MAEFTAGRRNRAVFVDTPRAYEYEYTIDYLCILDSVLPGRQSAGFMNRPPLYFDVRDH